MDYFCGERRWYAEKVAMQMICGRSGGAARKCGSLSISFWLLHVPPTKSMHSEIVLGSDVHVTVTMRICMR